MNAKVVSLQETVKQDDSEKAAQALASLAILADRGVKSVEVLFRIEEAVFGDCFHRSPNAIISEIQRLVSRPQDPNMFYRPGW